MPVRPRIPDPVTQDHVGLLGQNTDPVLLLVQEAIVLGQGIAKETWNFAKDPILKIFLVKNHHVQLVSRQQTNK